MKDPTSSNEKIGNTNQSSPAKHWFFTLKNILKHTTLIELLDPKVTRFRFQLEKGDTSDYEHYQGMMELPKKARLSELKKWLPPEIHLEKTRSLQGAADYCMKTETRLAGPWEKGFPIPLKIITKLYTWQENLLKIVLEEPNDRTINWYWDQLGNTGKTAFAKYLCIKHKAAYVNGKSNDILYAASLQPATIYIIDIPRTNTDVISYQAIEYLKNGIWFSGKYESKTTIINSPHVIVFANKEPQQELFSRDRWHIVNIKLDK